MDHPSILRNTPTTFQQRVIQNLTAVGLGAEYRLLGRLYLFAGGRILDYRYTGPGAPGAVSSPSTTDRVTYLVRAELRYKWMKNLTIAAGAEQTQAEFVYTPEQYDNRTRAIIGSVNWDRPKYFVHFFGDIGKGSPSTARRSRPSPDSPAAEPPRTRSSAGWT